MLCTNYLGRPFLATSNTNIDYKNGVSDIIYEDKEIELNIFKSIKYPMKEVDELEEVDGLEVCRAEVNWV